MNKLKQKMNHKFTHTILTGLVLFLSLSYFAQPIIVPNYTACPNQTITIGATWNNVGNVSYTLFTPPGSTPNAPAPAGVPWGANVTTYVVSNSGNPPTTSVHSYTLSGTGQSINGLVTNSVVFNITIESPPPLTLTNQVNYCPGETATITAPSGGNTYNLTSNCLNILGLQFPVITIPNLSAANNCTYMVTSVGACTVTGITSISVAPNTPISVSANTNICQNNGAVLGATLATGQNFQWIHPINGPLNDIVPTIHNITNAQPADAGVYTITAQFPFNSIFCPRSSVVTVSVVPTSPVNVSASPANIVCQNGKISFNAGANVTPNGWQWSGPQGFAASIPNPSINPAMPLNSGAYSVNALFTNNVITCTTSAAINVSVVSVNQPIVTMPPSVCKDGNVSMSASAPGALSFTWTGPNSFAQSTPSASINSAQPNASGVYYVTAMFGIVTPLCSSTSSAQLSVIPVNSVSVIPPPHICAPDNARLQANAIGANSYSWVGPNGFSQPGPVATVYNATPPVSGIYTVTAFFNGGNITCSNTNTLSLSVSAPLNFTLTPRQQVCYNSPIKITGPSGASSYTWTSSTGFSSNSKDIDFSSAQPNNSGFYILKVSLGQCVTSANTELEVLSPLDFTLVPQSRSICANDTTYLEAGMSGGSQNYVYTWIPSAFLEKNNGPKTMAIPANSVVYNVVVYDLTCPSFTISRSFSLDVQQAPKPSLNLDKTEGCEPYYQVYNPNTPDAWTTTYDFGGILKYQVNGEDSLDLSKLGNKEGGKPLLAGTYSLTIYSKGKNGCSGSYVFPYPIIVNPNPNTTILTNPENPSSFDEVTFIPSSQNGKVVDYLWNFSGGEPLVLDTSINRKNPGWDTSNVANPVRKYEAAGKYPVSLTSTTDRGCTDVVFKHLLITDDFRLFIPNSFTPNGDGINDIFSIKGTGVKLENYSMEILDRWANSVFFTKDIAQGWDGKVNGNDAEVGTYVYIIKAVGMNGEGRKEFVGDISVIK